MATAKIGKNKRWKEGDSFAEKAALPGGCVSWGRSTPLFSPIYSRSSCRRLNNKKPPGLTPERFWSFGVSEMVQNGFDDPLGCLPVPVWIGGLAHLLV